MSVKTTSKILSVRMDGATKRRLAVLAKQSKRSQSGLAAEAIAAFVDAEEWQRDQIRESMRQLDRGEGVPHERVADWLRSWGKPDEGRPPQ